MLKRFKSYLRQEYKKNAAEVIGGIVAAIIMFFIITLLFLAWIWYAPGWGFAALAVFIVGVIAFLVIVNWASQEDLPNKDIHT